MTSLKQFEKYLIDSGCKASALEINPIGNYLQPAIQLQWEAWQASRAWIKFSDELPKNRSKILIKGFDEVFLFQFGKVFCMDGDEFDFRDLEWQYRPE